jgi:CHAT domain-containing protein
MYWLVQAASGHASRKRVWWCPIGPLGSLPLHAAGVYEGPSQDHASNYIISSYVPTLAALHRLLLSKKDSAPRAVPGNMFLVAQPECMNQPSIPNTQVEADLVQSLIPAGWLVNRLTGRDLTVDAALQAVSNVNVLHFACHGHQDQENPLNSGFDMEDGRLTLGQLMRIRTPHAQLAYLSTCESAGMDEGRPDEGLNLASGMIFVGFKSVIGTLW